MADCSERFLPASVGFGSCVICVCGFHHILCGLHSPKQMSTHNGAPPALANCRKRVLKQLFVESSSYTRLEPQIRRHLLWGDAVKSHHGRSMPLAHPRPQILDPNLTLLAATIFDDLCAIRCDSFFVMSVSHAGLQCILVGRECVRMDVPPALNLADTAARALPNRGLGLLSSHNKQHILILQSNKENLGQRVAPNKYAGMLVVHCKLSPSFVTGALAYYDILIFSTSSIHAGSIRVVPWKIVSQQALLFSL